LKQLIIYQKLSTPNIGWVADRGKVS